MKKLADMWNALDDAAKQKYSEDAPLVEVKERKKPAAAAPAGHASSKAPMTAAPAEEVEPPATMEGLDLPSAHGLAQGARPGPARGARALHVRVAQSKKSARQHVEFCVGLRPLHDGDDGRRVLLPEGQLGPPQVRRAVCCGVLDCPRHRGRRGGVRVWPSAQGGGSTIATQAATARSTRRN